MDNNRKIINILDLQQQKNLHDATSSSSKIKTYLSKFLFYSQRNDGQCVLSANEMRNLINLLTDYKWCREQFFDMVDFCETDVPDHDKLTYLRAAAREGAFHHYL